MSCDAPPSTEDLMPRKSRYDRTQTCIKCKTQRGNLVIKHAVYCSSCLPAFLVRKFRRALSSSLDPAAAPRGTPSRSPPPDAVLGLSGGPSSTVLLDLVWKCFIPEGSGRKDERRQVGKVRAVHVDWACLGVDSLAESLREMCERYGVELTVVKGEAAFDPAWRATFGLGGESEPLTIDPSSTRLSIQPPPAGPSDPVASLLSYLRALPTPTSLPPAIHTLTRLLLLHTTASLSSPVLLLGTSLPRLSIDLLSNVAYGGGFSLSLEREETAALPLSSTPGMQREVKIVRPLRDWSLKELGWYLYHRQLRVPRGISSKPTLPLSPRGGKTLHHLTETFVLGLERDYPSTVSTISKTAGKVVPAGEAEGVCALCGRPRQRGASRWKEGTAILSLPIPGEGEEGRKELLTPPKTPPRSEDIGGNELADRLCYACYTHLTARGGTGAGKVVFPASMSTGATAEMRRAGEEGGAMPMPVWMRRKMGEGEMREKMGEFLLDEEE